MTESVDVRPSAPRLAKGCSRYRSNIENDGIENFYKIPLAIPFFDDINL